MPPTIVEINAIAAAAKPHARALILLTASTRLRAGEVTGLLADDVDLGAGTLEVSKQLITLPRQAPYRAEPKTRSSRRVVPIPGFAATAVRQHLAAFPADPSGLLFRGEHGGPLRRSLLQKLWRDAQKAAGLGVHYRFHHLRQFYASLLIDNGESVKVVQERLGHSSPVETLRTYAHLWPASLERTRTVLESAWADAAGPQSGASGGVLLHPDFTRGRSE